MCVVGLTCSYMHGCLLLAESLSGQIDWQSFRIRFTYIIKMAITIHQAEFQAFPWIILCKPDMLSSFHKWGTEAQRVSFSCTRKWSIRM